MDMTTAGPPTPAAPTGLPQPTMPRMPAMIGPAQNVISPTPPVPTNQPPPPAIGQSDLALSPAAARLRQIEQMLGAALETQVRPAPVAGRIKSLKDERANRRRPLENEWLEALNRYNGIYTGATGARLASNPNRSRVWEGITRSKTDAAHADIMDILRGNGDDQPWDLKAEHLPENVEIDPMLAAQGVTREILAEEYDIRARSMSNEIKMQMQEGDFDEQLDLAVHEMSILGTAGFKGPITVRDQKPAWEMNWLPDLTALSRAVPRNSFRPVCKFVSVLNLYPDMDVAEYDPRLGMIEVMPKSRRGMLDMALEPGVNSAAVIRCLKDYQRGNYSVEPHMQQVRTLAGDAHPSESQQWEVICFYGEVTGEELKLAGAEAIPEELMQISITAEIWVCGQYVLKARICTDKNGVAYPNPYHLCPMFKRGVPGPFGQGLPMRIAGSQDMLNGAMRAIMDNMAIASGPMLEVNLELATQEDNPDPTSIYGWKVIISRHDGNNSKRALYVHEVPVRTQEFFMIADHARRVIDEESSLPSLTGGMQGVGTTKTATGMSILNTNAGKTRDNRIRYIDDFIIEPVVEGYFWWNMTYNVKEWIKVPVKVIATGAQSMMAREMESQRLIQMLQVLAGNPIIREDELVKRAIRSIGFPAEDIVKSPQQIEMEQAAQFAAMGGMPPEPGQGGGAPPPRSLPAETPARPGGPPRMPPPDMGANQPRMRPRAAA